MSTGEGRYCPNCNSNNSVVAKGPDDPGILLCTICGFEDPAKSFPRIVERRK